jgi:hypothetical protein
MPPSVQRFFFARAPAGRSPIGNVWRFTGKRSDFYGVVPAAWRPAVVDENGRMETAARASEILALDIGDLDLRNRRAKVRRKGSAIDVVVWQTSTARLLPRLLTGRSGGPVFCTDRRARLPLAPIDVDTATGRAPTVLPPCRATLRAGHDPRSSTGHGRFTSCVTPRSRTRRRTARTLPPCCHTPAIPRSPPSPGMPASHPTPSPAGSNNEIQVPDAGLVGARVASSLQ